MPINIPFRVTAPGNFLPEMTIRDKCTVAEMGRLSEDGKFFYTNQGKPSFHSLTCSTDSYFLLEISLNQLKSFAITWWTRAHILGTLFDGRLSLLARQFQVGHVSPQSLNALHLERQLPHDTLHILVLLTRLLVVVVLHLATVVLWRRRPGQRQRGGRTELLLCRAEETIYGRRDAAAVEALLHLRLQEDVLEASLDLGQPLVQVAHVTETLLDEGLPVIQVDTTADCGHAQDIKDYINDGHRAPVLARPAALVGQPAA